MQLGDDSDSATLGDLRAADNEAPEEEVYRGIISEKVAEALEALPEDERKVIALRFGTEGEERTRAQVGRELRMSPQKAEQIERRALDRLSRMDTLEALREAAPAGAAGGAPPRPGARCAPGHPGPTRLASPPPCAAAPSSVN